MSNCDEEGKPTDWFESVCIYSPSYDPQGRKHTSSSRIVIHGLCLVSYLRPKFLMNLWIYEKSIAVLNCFETMKFSPMGQCECISLDDFHVPVFGSLEDMQESGFDPRVLVVRLLSRRFELKFWELSIKADEKSYKIRQPIIKWLHHLNGRRFFPSSFSS